MKNVLLLLAVTFFATASFAHNKREADELGARILIPVAQEDRYKSRIMVDAGQYSVEDFPSILAKFDSIKKDSGEIVSALTKPSDPTQIIVIVPRNAPESYRQEFLAQIQKSLSTHYPNARYEIHESFVDINKDAAALWEARAEIEKLTAKGPLTEEQKILADIAEQSIENGLASDQALCQSWFKEKCSRFYKYFNAKYEKHNHPYNTVVAAHAVALTKFGISATVTLSKYGINPWSAAIATVQGAITATFGFNAKAWSQWCTSHEFPFFKESVPVNFYNQHGWLKSASINMIRSLGLSYLIRLWAYSTGQIGDGRPVDSPNSLEFLAQGLGISLPEVILDGLVDDALRSLELGGHIRDSTRSYILWAISAIDTGMHTLFRINNLPLAYSVAAVSVLAKSGIVAAAKAVQPKDNRLFVISDLVANVPVNPPVPFEKGNYLKSIKNFMLYLSGRGVYFEWKNRTSEQFTVSDLELVKRYFGMTELITPFPTAEEQVKKLMEDPKLKEKDLKDILGLRDLPPEIFNAIYNYRLNRLNDHLPLDPIDMCATALAR